MTIYKAGVGEHVIRGIELLWYCPHHDVTGVKSVTSPSDRRYDTGNDFPGALFISSDPTGVNTDLSYLHGGNPSMVVSFRFPGRVVFPGLEPVEECHCAESAYKENLFRIGLSDGELAARRVYYTIRKTMMRRIECPSCRRRQTLWYTVQHLNDLHKWSRESVASWLETIAETEGLDLSFPTPAKIPKEPGEE